jgi:hypothetical protein
MRKDPFKTFIGGLVIGFITGGLVVAIVLANYFINTFI